MNREDLFKSPDFRPRQVICVVRDMRSQLFNPPFAQRSIAEAMRGWEVAANEGDSMIVKFPNDWRLYQLGEFDDETGKIRVFDEPKDLGSAADVKKDRQTGVRSVNS